MTVGQVAVYDRFQMHKMAIGLRFLAGSAIAAAQQDTPPIPLPHSEYGRV